MRRRTIDKSVNASNLSRGLIAIIHASPVCVFPTLLRFEVDRFRHQVSSEHYAFLILLNPGRTRPHVDVLEFYSLDDFLILAYLHFFQL